MSFSNSLIGPLTYRPIEKLMKIDITILTSPIFFPSRVLQIFVSSPQKRGSHIHSIIMQHFSPIYVAIIFVGAILVQSEAKRK